MKITNIRSEDLVYSISNNDLIEDDKNISTEIFKPKEYKHNPSPETAKKQNEWRRHKRGTDEEYIFNRTGQAKEYHQKKNNHKQCWKAIIIIRRQDLKNRRKTQYGTYKTRLN